MDSIEISDNLNEKIYEKIKKKYLFSHSQSTIPTAIILGGQPGAGKSFLVKAVEQEFQKDFIFISTDDLRLYHPAYQKLQKDPKNVQNAANLVNPYASAWTERLIKYCIENKYNLIIDSTLGGNITAVYDTIDMLRAGGFEFHLRLMAVPSLISKLSIFLRYESQLIEKGFARWTRIEDHDDRFEKIPQVLEQIISNKPPDTIRFFRRKLSDKITISLEPSQLFAFNNDSFSNFVVLEQFYLLRNQIQETDFSFIEHAIRQVFSSNKLENTHKNILKAILTDETKQSKGQLKNMLSRLINEQN
jgi:predicted ABC-type ATPase